MAAATTARLASIRAGTSGPSSARAAPAATSTTSATVSASPLTITVRMADSLPFPAATCAAGRRIRMAGRLLAGWPGGGGDPSARAEATAGRVGGMTAANFVIHENSADGANPAELVVAAASACLDLAATWLAWDGRPVARWDDGQPNVGTPHKALRRIADHLTDHRHEVEALLAGAEPLPDSWHGRLVTLDADWARFTELDLAEARSRVTRLA